MNPDETRTNYIPPPRDEFQKKFSEYKVDWAPIEEKIITPEYFFFLNLFPSFFL